VRDYLDSGNWQLLGEFTEIESGKRSDRPELANAIAFAKKHRAPGDRQARSVVSKRSLHRYPS
jgi:DNA invertase Pin-like site-specific DNA recombinase